ncbi:hypothetical protein [Streptomyces sp. NPDC001348]
MSTTEAGPASFLAVALIFVALTGVVTAIRIQVKRLRERSPSRTAGFTTFTPTATVPAADRTPIAAPLKRRACRRQSPQDADDRPSVRS